MKLKILLVKHFDHVILGALGILLFYALFQAFIARDTALDEIADEIRRAEGVINDALTDRTTPKTEIPDYLTQLRLRFERPRVISPFPHNPFYPEPDIIVERALQIGVGKVYEKELERAHLVEVVQTKDILKVEFDYDPEIGSSVVTIEALKKGQTDLRIRDSRERTYRWRVYVLKDVTSDPPRPPIFVTTQANPPYERRNIRKPARVLITFRHDNPEAPGEGVGITTGAFVERKLADTPDVEYIRVTADPVIPASQSEIDEKWRRFIEPEEEPDDDVAATPEPTRTGRPVGGVFVPTEAGAAPRRAQRQPQTYRSVIPEGKPLKGAYVFLDDTVDPGESYVYRITTISASEDADPVPCKKPFVTPIPTVVPSLVSFALISGGGRVAITRANPESGEPLTEEFSLLPGMSIQGRKRIRVTVRRNGVDRVQWREVDFDMNCVMVDMLTLLSDINYRVRYDWRKEKFTFLAKSPKSSLLLYLTPRSALRWKQKETLRRQPGERMPQPKARPATQPRPPRSSRPPRTAPPAPGVRPRPPRGSGTRVPRY